MPERNDSLETNGQLSTDASIPSGRPRGLRLWFFAGFLPVFVGMLLLVKVMAMHPSGQYVVQYPLWQYYKVALSRLFAASTMGPASSNGSQLAEMIGQHLSVSAAGGLLAVAIVGWLRKRTSQPEGHTTDESAA